MASDKVKQAELRAQGLYSLGPDSWTYSLSYEESLGGKKNLFIFIICGMGVHVLVCVWAHECV